MSNQVRWEVPTAESFPEEVILVAFLGDICIGRIERRGTVWATRFDLSAYLPGMSLYYWGSCSPGEDPTSALNILKSEFEYDLNEWLKSAGLL